MREAVLSEEVTMSIDSRRPKLRGMTRKEIFRMEVKGVSLSMTYFLPGCMTSGKLISLCVS